MKQSRNLGLSSGAGAEPHGSTGGPRHGGGTKTERPPVRRRTKRRIVRLPADRIQQARHPLRTVVVLLLSSMLVIGGFWAVSSSGVIANRFKPTLERELTKALHRPVTVGRLEGGVFDRVVVRDVRIGAPAADAEALDITIERVVVRYSLWDILVRKAPLADSLREIQLIKPLIRFEKDAAGTWRGPNLLSWPAPDSRTPKFPALKITLVAGELRFTDPEHRASLHNVKGQFNLKNPADARLYLSGRTDDRRAQNVKASGEFDLIGGAFHVAVSAGHLRLRPFERVAQPSPFLEILDGKAGLEIQLTSRGDSPSNRMREPRRASRSGGRKTDELIPGVDLQGKIVLEDVSLKTSLLAEPLRGVYGVTLISNDRLQIKSMQATWGSTNWKAAGVVSRLQQPVVDVKVSNDHIRLEDLAAAVPKFKQLQSEGEASALIALRGQAPEVKATATLRMAEGRIGNVHIRDFESISRFSGKELRLLLARGHVARGWIEGKGAVVFAEDSKTSPQVTLTGEAKGLALEEIASLFGVKMLNGAVDGTIAVVGPADRLAVCGTVSSERIAAAGMEFKRVQGSLELNPGGMTVTARADWGTLPAVLIRGALDRRGANWILRQVRLYQNGTELVRAGGEADTGPSGALRVQIHARRLPVRSLPYLPPALHHLNGNVNLDGFLGGTMRQMCFVGRFQSPDLLRLPARTMDAGGDVMLNGKQLILRSFAADHGSIQAQGALAWRSAPAVRAEIAWRQASLDGVAALLGAPVEQTLPQGSLSGQASLFGPLRQMRSRGNIELRRLSWRGIEADSGKIDFNSDSGRFRVRKMELRQAQGYLEAELEANLERTGADNPFQMRGTLKNFGFNGRAWDGSLKLDGNHIAGSDGDRTQMRLSLDRLKVGDRRLPAVLGQMVFFWKDLSLQITRLDWGKKLSAAGRLQAGPHPGGSVQVTLDHTRLGALREVLTPGRGPLPVPASGTLQAEFSEQDGKGGLNITLGTGNVAGEISWQSGPESSRRALTAEMKLTALPLKSLAELFMIGVDHKLLLKGTATGNMRITTAGGKLGETSGRLEVAEFVFGEWIFKHLKLGWDKQGKKLEIKQLEGIQPDGSLRALGGSMIENADGFYELALDLQAENYKLLQRFFNGRFSARGSLRFKEDIPDLQLRVASPDFGLNLCHFKDFSVDLHCRGQEMNIQTAPDLPYRIEADLRLPPDGRVEFRDLELRDAETRQKYVVMTGILDGAGEGRSDLKVLVNGVGADTIARSLNWPQPWTGTASGTIHYTDPGNVPAFTIDVKVENGSVLNLPFDTFEGTLVLDRNWLYFKGPEHGCALTRKEKYTLFLQGKMPLPSTPQASVEMRGAEMDVHAWMPEGDFSYITFIPYFSAAKGRSSLDLFIRGTVEYPSLSGSATVMDGSLSPRLYTPLVEHLNGSVRFDSNKVFVDRLEGRIGEGILEVKPGPAAPWLAVFRRLEPDELNVALVSKNGRIWFDSTVDYEFVSAWAKLQATIGGTLESPVFGGAIELADGQFTYPPKNLSAFTRSLKGTNVQYNGLKLIARKNLWFYNDVVRAQIRPDNSVTLNGGRNDFSGTGRIALSRGTINFSDTDFNLDPNEEAFVTFQGHEAPRLSALANTTIRDVQIKDEGRTRDAVIYLRVGGPLGELKIDLSSEPVMTQAQIISLLTLGEDYSNWSKDALNQEVQMFGARILGKVAGNMLGREIERRVKKIAPVDVIGIRFGGVEQLAGNIVSGSNTGAANASSASTGTSLLQNTQIDVGKYITDDLYVNYRGTIKDRGIDNGGLSLQSRLGVEYNLGSSRKFKVYKNFDADSNQEFFWGIEARNEFKSWSPNDAEGNTADASGAPKGQARK